jgi:hypothetical protein
VIQPDCVYPFGEPRPKAGVMKFLSTAPPVGQLDVDGVTLALVRAKHNAVFDRVELRGVSIHLAASSAEPSERGWRIQAALGSRESSLGLDLARAPDGSARGRGSG